MKWHSNRVKNLSEDISYLKNALEDVALRWSDHLEGSSAEDTCSLSANFTHFKVVHQYSDLWSLRIRRTYFPSRTSKASKRIRTTNQTEGDAIHYIPFNRNCHDYASRHPFCPQLLLCGGIWWKARTHFYGCEMVASSPTNRIMASKSNFLQFRFNEHLASYKKSLIKINLC